MTQKLLLAAAGGLGLLLISVFFVPASLVSSVPLLPPELLAKYKDIANNHMPHVPWWGMVAIDTVRYSQDWEKPTDASIYDLANRFGRCWGEWDGKHKWHLICNHHSMDEVADSLGFTQEQKDHAHIYLKTLEDMQQQ